MNNRTEDEGSMETSLRNSSTFRALEKTRKEKEAEWDPGANQVEISKHISKKIEGFE